MPLSHILAPLVLQKTRELMRATQPVSVQAKYVDEGSLPPMVQAQRVDESKFPPVKYGASNPPGVKVQANYVGAHPDVKVNARYVDENAPALRRGYLTIGAGKGKPVMPQQEPTEYDSSTPIGAYYGALHALPKGYEAFRGGALRGGEITLEKPIPNYAPPTQAAKKGKPGKYLQFAPGEEIGIAENGQPIRAPIPAGKPVITAPAGQPFAVNERGESLDVRGKNLGYLNKQDPSIRYADRRLSDVNMEDRDALGQSSLEQTFGPHMKEMVYDPKTKKMQFSPGYFEGMSKKDREAIKAGVKELASREKGTPT